MFGTWQAWADYVELLVRTNSIIEFTQLWWSVRPHHDFGTVEVRVCDAQTTGPEADALAQLIVGCVARAVAEVDAGDPADLPGRLIEENMWRACATGSTGLLDLEAPVIEEFPAAETLDRLKAWSGVDVPFPELTAPSASGGSSMRGPHQRRCTRCAFGRHKGPTRRDGHVSTQEPQFSDEELRAIEAEMQKITVDDVLLQTIVTLLNVGARKAGLATQPQPGETPPEPDLEQVHQAVEGARALLRSSSRATASSSGRSRTRSRGCRCSTRSARPASPAASRGQGIRAGGVRRGQRTELRTALGSGQ